MVRVYRTDLIPQWVWIFLGISGLLILLVVLSMAATRSQREVIVVGPEVRTGSPQDYIKRPPDIVQPPVTQEPPTVAEPPIIIVPPPTQQAEPDIPARMPANFTYNGVQYRFSDGPIEIDVETTGELTNRNVIYRRAGDRPPYRALFLETAPNSHRFYRYIPAQG